MTRSIPLPPPEREMLQTWLRESMNEDDSRFGQAVEAVRDFLRTVAHEEGLVLPCPYPASVAAVVEGVPVYRSDFEPGGDVREVLSERLRALQPGCPTPSPASPPEPVRATPRRRVLIPEIDL